MTNGVSNTSLGMMVENSHNLFYEYLLERFNNIYFSNLCSAIVFHCILIIAKYTFTSTKYKIPTRRLSNYIPEKYYDTCS